MGSEHSNKVGVVGCGVIGMSWTLFFLSKGYDVIVFDPNPATESKLHDYFENARQAFEQNDIPLSIDLGKLTFVTEINELMGDVDFIQECGPEKIEIKQTLIQQLEKYIRKDVIISSSSSGLHVSQFQHFASEPGRIILGHPFNPPHLVPLVEVCAGNATTESCVKKTIDFYQKLGKKVVRLNKEITGHIANRLQAAIIREVLYLLSENVASLADIDRALADGPGLRWGLMGQFMTSNLGGGNEGISHFLEHLGGPIESWWADLGQLEKITPELIHMASDGIQQYFQTSGIDQPSLQESRDRQLLKLIRDKQEDPVISKL